MAITAIHAQLFKSLPLPRGGSLLEIGEANWYGDADPRDFGLTPREDLFAVAKEFYAKTFAPSRMVAIDKHGTCGAFQLDLNESLSSPINCTYCTGRIDPETGRVGLGTFDIVINHGTAEHIFNIAQVFRTMHDACDVGGFLIHDAPFTGWIDHGFYCLQPTLFYDVAAANNYEISSLHVTEIRPPSAVRLESREHAARLSEEGKLPKNANLFVVFRKRVDKPFRIPMQGYYANQLSASGAKAWEALR